MWNPFKAKPTPPSPQTAAVTRTLRLAMSKEVARTITGLDFSRAWVCPCGATLRQRARDDRGEGPSNYQGVYPAGHKDAGHSVVPHGDLNWRGLAEEVGWVVDPTVICPACQHAPVLGDFRAQAAAAAALQIAAGKDINLGVHAMKLARRAYARYVEDTLAPWRVTYDRWRLEQVQKRAAAARISAQEGIQVQAVQDPAPTQPPILDLAAWLKSRVR